MRDLTCTRTIDLDIITAEKLKKRAHLISFRWRRVRVVMAWKIIKSSKMAIHTLVDLFIFPLWNLTGLKSVGTGGLGPVRITLPFESRKSMENRPGGVLADIFSISCFYSNSEKFQIFEFLFRILLLWFFTLSILWILGVILNWRKQRLGLKTY